MSSEQLQRVLGPKVQGTINLHEATLGSPLDFFVMTSSVATMIAPATQASYCAANSFQDAFARHRLSRGLPAQSIAFGLILEVGLATRLPEIRKSLARNGLYGTGELGFLRLLEAAFVPQTIGDQWRSDPLAQAHLLTGLEASKLVAVNDRNYHWHSDARVGPVLQAIEDLLHSQFNKTVGTTVLDKLSDAPPGEMRKLVMQAIIENLAKLLFMPVDEIDATRAVSNYGMDSMIAAELRNWLVKVFETDIPFLELLDPGMKIEMLADRIVDGRKQESQG